MNNSNHTQLFKRKAILQMWAEPDYFLKLCRFLHDYYYYYRYNNSTYFFQIYRKQENTNLFKMLMQPALTNCVFL